MKIAKYDNGTTYKRFICPNPFLYAELQENGDISTCCYIHHSFGNINNLSLYEIWNSDDIKELRRSIIEGDYSYCDSSKCASMQHVIQVHRKKISYQIPYQLVEKEDNNSSIVKILPIT